MRTRVLYGNWKMFKTVPEAVATVEGLLARPGSLPGEVGIAPPFPALSPLAAKLAGSGIKLAGQNIHWEDEGAFTGEVSGPMLVSAGCSAVIIGHSERRQLFGETNESVKLKVQAALRSGLTPILCIGEDKADRASGLTLKKVEGQLKSALDGLAEEKVNRVVVAYEPIWAIGTGVTATPVMAQEVHSYIRGLLAKLLSPGLAQKVRIIYGGSVRPDNFASLLEQPDIDGALVGGASLRVETFGPLIDALGS